MRLFKKLAGFVMFLLVCLVLYATVAFAATNSVMSGIDWTSIIKEVVGPLVLVAIAIFGKVLHNILTALLGRIKNPSFRNLATEAVLWAKDKWGPDGSGATMLAGAVAYLSGKTGLSEIDAEVKIRAAFQEIFGNLPKAAAPVVTISTGAGITPPAAINTGG